MKWKRMFLIGLCLIILRPAIFAAPEDDEVPKEMQVLFPQMANLVWIARDPAAGEKRRLWFTLHQLIPKEKEKSEIYEVNCVEDANGSYVRLWQRRFSLPAVSFKKGGFFDLDHDPVREIVLNFSRDELFWYSIILSGREGKIIGPGGNHYFCSDGGPILLEEPGRLSIPWRIYWYESPYRTPSLYYLNYIWDGKAFAPAFRFGSNIFAWFSRTQIKIDGSMSDWPANAANCHPLLSEKQIYWQMEPWRGARDLSANIAVLWDKNAIYFLIKVSDDVVYPAPKGMEIWKGDFVELWFDWSLWTDYHESRFDGDDLHIGIKPKSNGENASIVVLQGDPGYKIEKASVGGGLSAGGYWLEARIPWPQGLNPGNKNIAGFAVSISDTDTKDKPLRNAISNQTGFQWGNPTTFGNLIFVR